MLNIFPIVSLKLWCWIKEYLHMYSVFDEKYKNKKELTRYDVSNSQIVLTYINNLYYY